ncbi:MAG: GNAT family N-acetyltransferase [Methanobacteriaceae archaeon]|nr:GNAT family N-acetyltransferase [Methanobacteriaceae archaeon]MDP2836652.1 GNAT family N-acetyltransferase [Methanobacteriaceae archaeon]MDP3485460.1 GNAT family N-acetyltransferase [Methanobacteriaceae archaeon]
MVILIKDKILLNDLIIQKLNSKHDISNFDCSDTELNGFLFENSMVEMKAKMNVTYVAVYDLKIIAYFTLSSDSIKINSKDKQYFEEKGIPYVNFPALKIGRLAVDKNYYKKGVGTEIILRIVGFIIKLNERIGSRFITVDAYVNSYNFYKKNNFTEFTKNRNSKYIALYFDPFKII